MQLTPREKDKLLVAMAAEVARKRLGRGVKLNYPEAIALITDAVVEGARDGRSVADDLSWRRSHSARILEPAAPAWPDQSDLASGHACGLAFGNGLASGNLGQRNSDGCGFNHRTDTAGAVS